MFASGKPLSKKCIFLPFSFLESEGADTPRNDLDLESEWEPKESACQESEERYKNYSSQLSHFIASDAKQHWKKRKGGT